MHAHSIQVKKRNYSSMVLCRIKVKYPKYYSKYLDCYNNAKGLINNTKFLVVTIINENSKLHLI